MVTALAPHPGRDITAMISDPDDRVRNEEWQWSRSSTRNGSYVNIATECRHGDLQPDR